MNDKNKTATIKTKAKMYGVVKSYYDILDDLAARLQADYAACEDHKPFEQQEEDRLAICFILDYFDDLKNEIKTIKRSTDNEK